jgi:hypothetical protein
MPCRGPRRLPARRIEVDHRVELRSAIVNGGNAIEVGARQRARRERSGGHPPLRVGDAQIDDVNCRGGGLHAGVNHEEREEREDHDTPRH